MARHRVPPARPTEALYWQSLRRCEGVHTTSQARTASTRSTPPSFNRRPNTGRAERHCGLSKNQWCTTMTLRLEKKTMPAFERPKTGSALISSLDFSLSDFVAKLRPTNEGEKAIYKFNRRSSQDPIDRHCFNIDDFIRFHKGKNKRQFQD